MTDIPSQNVPFLWATQFVRESYRCGLRHAVISPGSRSTPLTLALAAHAGIDKHVILDERSAGFIALGIGKATGIPALLVCTSGTAAANYYPVVIEAYESGVPLIVATADRPPHLRTIGASQAIDQVKLFGNYTVFFHEVGEPYLKSRDIDRLRIAVNQAFHRACRMQGPVHLNFPFRKPLEPDTETVSTVERENRQLEPAPPKTEIPPLDATYRLPAAVRELIEHSDRPVIVAGPNNLQQKVADAAGELAGELGAPLLADACGSMISPNLIEGFDAFLRHKETGEALSADLIVRFGDQPVSKALNRYLKTHREAPQIHFAGSDRWHDETHSLTHRIDWDGNKIHWEFDPAGTDASWLNRWKEQASEYHNYRSRQLKEVNNLTDGHVFNTLSARIPDSWNIFLSNSFPLRDMGLFGSVNNQSMWANRGASGIDGVTSTAMGTVIGSDKSGILLTGDLAFLHDTTALLNAALLEKKLVIVLLNNNGGTIFRMLPIAEHGEYYRRYFETPQQADFSNIAASYGLDYTLADSLESLDKIDPSSLAGSKKVHLIECRTDPEASMELRNKLWSYPAS